MVRYLEFIKAICKQSNMWELHNPRVIGMVHNIIKCVQEEKELSQWLDKPESELKIFYGQPDKIEFLETRNRYYVYSSKKYNISCVRKFEINPNNIVVGFTSKNCF